MTDREYNNLIYRLKREKKLKAARLRYIDKKLQRDYKITLFIKRENNGDTTTNT